MARDNEDREQEPISGLIIDPEVDESVESGQESDQTEPETITLEPHEYGEPTHRAPREKNLFGDDEQSAPTSSEQKSKSEKKKAKAPRDRGAKRTKKLKPDHDFAPSDEPESGPEVGPEEFIRENFDANDPWVREMNRKRAERDASSEGRSSYTFEGQRYLRDGLVDTGNPEADLRTNVNNAGKSFMNGVVDETAEDANKATTALKRQQLYDNMSSKHKMYTMMMGMSCLAGLRNGVTPSAVIRSATMAATMWACSPNFRLVAGGMLGPKLEPMQEKMKEGVDKFIDARREREAKKVGKAVGKADAEGKPLSRKWDQRLHDSMHTKDGRMPFSVQSAAMTEVSLNEGFFKAQRKPGADVDSLRDTHQFVLEKLYTEAAADGIDPESISKASRTLIGHQIDDNPEYAAMYEELAHVSFEKAPARTVRIEGTEQTASVWSGEYRNDFGQKITSGSFAVRGPMSSADHQSKMAQTIAGDMLSAKSVSSFNASMMGYGLGLKMELDPQERGQLKPEVADRMDRADKFYNAMSSDGVEVEEMEKVYSNAYLDALDIVRSRNPELEEEWTHRYGEGWQERFQMFMDDPQGFMKRTQDEKAAREKWGPRGEPFVPDAKTAEDSTRPDQQEPPATPESQTTAGKYRRAKRNQGYNKIDTGGVMGLGVDDYDPGADFELGG